MKRRCVLALGTTSRHFSTEQSWLSVPGNPLMKWPLSPSPTNPQLQLAPHLSYPAVPQQISNLEEPNTYFDRIDFTTICDLLTNPILPPGPALETALDRTGIKPGPLLLREIFGHFDSSPRPLFTLFIWAEKQQGYKFDVSLLNFMINMLGKAREFDSAWCLILDRLSSTEGPNLETFSILIRRYTRAGMPLAAIRTHGYASNLDLFHSSILEVNLFEILLDSLCKEGHVRVASEHFDQRRKVDPGWVPSTRVYNILLNGWFRARKLKWAERLWAEMKKENVEPSVVTYGTLVEGYCRMRRVEIAILLVDEMRRRGIEPNAIVYNPIIDALGEAGRFKEALGMMERFSVLDSGPTISTYNSLVKGFCKSRDLVGASMILKMMINKGVVPTPTTYNYFFRHFSKFGKIEEGLNLYTKMTVSGYTPDRLTYHLLIKMLCEQQRLDLAMQITKEMRAKGCDLDLATSTMLIHLLCKMHKFDDAFGEFEDMIRRGIVPQYLTYQKMTDELKKQGRADIAWKLTEMMASVPHSMKLPNTYRAVGDSMYVRKISILQKAEAMSDILKRSRDKGELIKHTNLPKNAVQTANQLMDDIKRRMY